MKFQINVDQMYLAKIGWSMKLIHYHNYSNYKLQIKHENELFFHKIILLFYQPKVLA